MAQVVLWALPGEWEQVELFAPDLDDRIATRVRSNAADSGSDQATPPPSSPERPVPAAALHRRAALR